MKRNWWRVEYDVIYVNNSQISGKVLFVQADRKEGAQERVRFFEQPPQEPIDGPPIRTFSFQEPMRLDLVERSGDLSGIGVIVYESSCWYARGPALTVPWSELAVAALNHEVPDISDQGDFDALFTSLGLTFIDPISEGSPVSWVRCFEGWNKIGDNGKAKIDRWQKAGADVQWRRAAGFAGAA